MKKFFILLCFFAGAIVFGVAVSNFFGYDDIQDLEHRESVLGRYTFNGKDERESEQRNASSSNDNEVPYVRSIPEDPKRLRIPGEPFGSFTEETEWIQHALSYLGGRSYILAYHDPVLGTGYANLIGEEELVKTFANKAKNSTAIRDVKVMWNDYWKSNDIHAEHQDLELAEQMVTTMIDLYAPKLRDVVFKAYFRNEDRSFETEHFLLEFTYYRGPSIDQRLMVIKPL